MNTFIITNCSGLRVLDIPKHHPCFLWERNAYDCEIEWPCEVRHYLQSISFLVQITRGLLSYGTVVIIFLGLFLNTLSFYTLLSSGLSKNGSGLYLVTLAICDSGNLITNYAVGVARGHIPRFNQYFMDHEWLCRFHAVFVEVFQLMSAWIVVSFTVERCIAVWYPMMLRNTSRRKKAQIVVTSVVSVFTLFGLSKLFLTGFERNSVFGYPPCQSRRLRWHGMAYVRVAFQTWIPTVMVFVFNCLMLYKIRKIKRKRKSLTEYKTKGKRGRVKGKFNEGSRRSSFINRPSPTAPMLMAVSLTYLVLVFPLGVIQTIELFWSVRHKPPPYNGEAELRDPYVQWKSTKMLLKYIRSFCFGFYQINSAINFFLYFAAGLQFRLHLQHKVSIFLGRFGIKLACCDVDNPITNKASTGTKSTYVSAMSNGQKRNSEGKLYQNRNQSLNGVASPRPSTSKREMANGLNNNVVDVESAVHSGDTSPNLLSLGGNPTSTKETSLNESSSSEAGEMILLQTIVSPVVILDGTETTHEDANLNSSQLMQEILEEFDTSFVAPQHHNAASVETAEDKFDHLDVTHVPEESLAVGCKQTHDISTTFISSTVEDLVKCSE